MTEQQRKRTRAPKAGAKEVEQRTQVAYHFIMQGWPLRRIVNKLMESMGLKRKLSEWYVTRAHKRFRAAAGKSEEEVLELCVNHLLAQMNATDARVSEKTKATSELAKLFGLSKRTINMTLNAGRELTADEKRAAIWEEIKKLREGAANNN